MIEIFERFTERARQVVVLAQDEARAFGHAFIGTEHVLLGLLREEEGLAARVLTSLGVTVEEVRRAQVARIVGQGDEVTTGQIPFTPRAKKVLELALREALSLGHNYIGTEHILLGLVREKEGVGARILLGLVTLSDDEALDRKIQNEVVKKLEGKRPPIKKPTLPPTHREMTLELISELGGLVEELRTRIMEKPASMESHTLALVLQADVLRWQELYNEAREEGWLK